MYPIKWHVLKGANTWYAKRNRVKPYMLHGFLTGWILVDHINGNGLDNRRANLRLASHAQNHANSQKRKGKSSPYKGVSWSRSGAKWMATIRSAGKTTYLGVFTNPIEAAKAYDRAASEIYGEFARVNFTQERSAS